MSDSILWLDKATRADIPRVGGKAANLGEMLHAGLPVPGGFCVTVEAYRQQLEQTALGAELKGLLEAHPGDDAALSKVIKALFQEAALTPEIDASLREAYLALGDGVPVAVRSSATSEDSAEASFAGQHETLLGVRGVEDLAAALRECWASLWSERAISYRTKRGIAPDGVAIAVVVQRMVEADAAGVLFTIDPVAGRSDRMVLTASWGLGEAVVSGLVSPDTFTLQKDALDIVERRIQRKEQMVTLKQRRSEIEAVPAARQEVPSLDDAQVRAVAEMGVTVERHYGAPQDIEWAIAAGEVFMLQTRPVTTLKKEPEEEADALPDAPLPTPDEGVYGWVDLTRVPRLFRRRLAPLLLRGWILDHFPEPLRPMDIYVMIGAVVTGQRRFAKDIGLTVPSDPARVHPSGLVLYKVPLPFSLRLLWELPRALVRVRALQRHDPLREWKEVDEPHLRPQVDLAVKRARDGLSMSEVPKEIRRVMGVVSDNMHRRFGKYMPAGNVAGQNLTKLLKKVAPDRAGELEQRLLQSNGHKTSRIQAALKALARAADSEPAARRILVERPFGERLAALRAEPACAGFARQLDEFLEDNGCRTAVGMEPVPSYPAWRDAPEELLSVMAAMLSNPSGLADDTREKEQQYLEARAWVRERISRSEDVERFERLVDLCRGFLVAREDTLYLFEECITAIRAHVKRVASALVAEGKLRGEQDVFYLSHDELERLIEAPKESDGARDLGATAAQRRAVWVHARASLQRVGEAAPSAQEELVGTGASPGTATGTVKVVRGPQDFGKLRPGDILVCAATNPAWTPLFSIASAVVTDIGGVLSHAAIVAREYGIPAVMGCSGATGSLSDGDQIEVDGVRGTVRKLRSG